MIVSRELPVRLLVALVGRWRPGVTGQAHPHAAAELTGQRSVDPHAMLRLLWRPIPPRPGHQTPFERLWHIGAATHPGPGLSGASGHIVATHLLRRGPLERLRGLLAAR